MKRGIVLGLLAALVLVGALGAVKAYRMHQTAELVAEQCREVTALNAERDDDRAVSHGDTSALILGDSYAQGQYLRDPRTQAWSTLVSRRLDWTTHVDAVGGSGLISDGPCGGQSIPQRAEADAAMRPDVLVIQTGLNDSSSGDLAGALDATLEEVPADRVVVVGPVDAPARDGEQAVDAAMREAASDDGAEYVSALGWDLPYLSDGVHLTTEGHAMFAARVAARVEARG